MKLGIVGLPNVGKSTLFNALTKAGAESANYPFCTIEPNVGIVRVPDERLGEAVMAVVQLRPGQSLSLPELQEHCKKYLSSYKKPLYMETVDSFDMDDAGKIRRSRLRSELKKKYESKL